MTGNRARQRKGSILCPNCDKLISADESRCPYCNTANPGSWWKNNTLIRGLADADQLIKAIIYINIGMYVISLLIEPAGIILSLNDPFHFLSPDSGSLLLLGATGSVPIDVSHRWWSLLAANYLHGNILHILFNMLAVRQLSTLVMEEYGTYRTIILYTLGGVIGFFISYLAGVRFTIGASAAVCSLIGATLYFGKSRGGVYGQAVYRQVRGWVVGLFLFGLMLPGINNWGHGGGLLAGFLLGYLLGYREKRRENLIHKCIAVGCVVATAAVLGWGVFSGVVYRLFGVANG